MSPFAKTVMDQMKKRSMLELWTGVIGNQSLKGHNDRQARNIAAEDAAGRKAAGWPEPDMSEEMGDTILGDVDNRKSGIGTLGLLMAGLAGAAAIGGPLAGYMMAGQAAKAVIQDQDDTDTTAHVGLGKLEEYLEKQIE